MNAKEAYMIKIAAILPTALGRPGGAMAAADIARGMKKVPFPANKVNPSTAPFRKATGPLAEFDAAAVAKRNALNKVSKPISIDQNKIDKFRKSVW